MYLSIQNFSDTSRRPSSQTHLVSECVMTRYLFPDGADGELEVYYFDYSQAARTEWDELNYSWGEEVT
jgi:hypothetical protein